MKLIRQIATLLSLAVLATSLLGIPTAYAAPVLMTQFSVFNTSTSSDANGRNAVFAEPGDTIEFRIQYMNFAGPGNDATNATLAVNMSAAGSLADYVANSTELDSGGGWGAVADSIAGDTLSPYDDGSGAVVDALLTSFESGKVRWRMKMNAAVTSASAFNVTAEITSDAGANTSGVQTTVVKAPWVIISSITDSGATGDIIELTTARQVAAVAAGTIGNYAVTIGAAAPITLAASGVVYDGANTITITDVGGEFNFTGGDQVQVSIDNLIENEGALTRTFDRGGTGTDIPDQGNAALTALTNATVTGGNGFWDPDTEFIYIDNDTSNTVTAGDTRLARRSDYAVASAVAGGDSDLGDALNVLANATVTGGDGTWTVGSEEVYVDADGSNTITASDVRVIEAGGLTALTNATVTGGNGVWQPATEEVYIDNDASNTITANDRRVTRVDTSLLENSTVSCNADSDCAAALAALTNATVTGGDGSWSFGNEFVYIDNDVSGTITVGDTRVTFNAGDYVTGPPTYTTQFAVVGDADKPRMISATAVSSTTIEVVWNENLADPGLAGDYGITSYTVNNLAFDGLKTVTLTLSTTIDPDFTGTINIAADVVTDVNDGKLNDVIVNEIIQDGQSPSLVSAGAIRLVSGSNVISVKFNETVDPASATALGNWTIESPVGTPISLASAIVDSNDNASIIFTTNDALVPGNAIQATIGGGTITDLAGNFAGASFTGGTVADGTVVINEFYPGDGQEFIEIYNASGSSVDISNWTIEDGTGLIHTFPASTSLAAFNLTLATQPADLAGNPLNDLGDIIILKDSNGIIRDRVAYGNWNDGNISDNACNPPNVAGQSCGRNESGTNTGVNSVDFTETPAPPSMTPGLLNDYTAPTTSPDFAAGTFGADVTVTFTATDNGSGVEFIYYTIDGTNPTVGGPTTLTSLSPLQYTFTDGMNVTIKYFARDNVGNEEAVNSGTYKVAVGATSVVTVGGGGGGGGGGGSGPRCGNDLPPYNLGTASSDAPIEAKRPVRAASGTFPRPVILRHCYIDMFTHVPRGTVAYDLDGQIITDYVIPTPYKVPLARQTDYVFPTGRQLITKYTPVIGDDSELFNQPIFFHMALDTLLQRTEHLKDKVEVIYYVPWEQEWYTLGDGNMFDWENLTFEHSFEHATVVAFVWKDRLSPTEPTTPDQPDLPDDSPDAPADGTFSDTAGHWADGYLSALSEMDVINGYSDGTFRPDQSLSRREMVKLALTLFDYQTTIAETMPFPDVYMDDWAVHFIHTARQRNIVSGFGDGMFRPAEEITRAQLLKIALNAAGLSLPDQITNTFTDTPDYAWYYPYVGYAQQLGLVSGYQINERTETSVVPGESSDLISQFSITDANLGLGDTEDAVYPVQALLRDLGYLSGGQDGVFDQTTKTAVGQLQIATGILSPSSGALGNWGPVTRTTLSKLTARLEDKIETTTVPSDQPGLIDKYAIDSSNLTLGVTGHSVSLVQNLLRDLGYLTGGEEGVFDQTTKTAVGQLQIDAGILSPDSAALGNWGPATRATLSKLVASRQDKVETHTVPSNQPDLITQYAIDSTNLTLGSANPAVAPVQALLRDLGYLVDGQDGVFDQLTKDAVGRLQIDAGILSSGSSALGNWGPATRATLSKLVAHRNDQASTPRDLLALYPIGRLLGVGDSDALYGTSDVANLQHALSELGHYSGTISGEYDDSLASALLAFQQAQGLAGPTQTISGGFGQLGPQTKSLLEAALARASQTDQAIAIFSPVPTTEVTEVVGQQVIFSPIPTTETTEVVGQQVVFSPAGEGQTVERLVSDLVFRPDQPITRAEAAALLWRVWKMSR